MMAAAEATVKLGNWRPHSKPPNDECAALRELVVQAVFGCYYEKKQLLAEMGKPPQPVSLDEIYLRVQVKVDQKQRIGKWRYGWTSKRTVDRRVNEAATKKYAENGVPKIVAITSGFYRPNPALLEESE